MARTIAQVYDSLMAAKVARPELDDLTTSGQITYQSLMAELNSESRVAMWRLLIYVYAVGLQLLERFLDLHVAEVDDKIQNGIAGTRLWFAYIAKRYQHGDVLEFDEAFVPKYPTQDPAAQIISYAAVTESSAGVLLRVAKRQNSLPVKLSASELAGLTYYMNEVKPAGMPLVVRSTDADVVQVTAQVFYQAGYVPSTIVSQCVSQITSMLTNASFGEALRVNAVEDAMQAVTGVTNVRLTLLTAQAEGLTTQVFNLSQGINLTSYNSFSGYFNAGTLSITAIQL